MSDPEDSPDRRKRSTGDDPQGDPDGRDVAAALYGGDVSALTGDSDGEEEDEEPDLFD